MTDGERRFWTVNSYGYPNPFNSDEKSQGAWQTFLSFFDFESYADLKTYYQSRDAPRLLSAHSVESWKATLEEFGLLYVLSRSGRITITPAGNQFREAGASGHREEFAWLGLSLLLRYPLRGARCGRTGRHEESDLLLYWFLYAAILDLENTLWWTELERVLSTVFRRAEAPGAIDTIRRLRAREIAPRDLPLVADQRGAFYNSLNQVLVHGSMNDLIFGRSSDDVFYGESEIPRRHWILQQWRRLVEDAVGGVVNECEENRSFVARMPAAPNFGEDEQAYFEYLGHEVGPRPTTPPELQYVSVEGNPVVFLREHTHYELRNPNVLGGRTQQLCQLRNAQRVILSHDLIWSYLVQGKRRINADTLEVDVRRGRPITNAEPLRRFLTEGEPNGRSS